MLFFQKSDRVRDSVYTFKGERVERSEGSESSGGTRVKSVIVVLTVKVTRWGCYLPCHLHTDIGSSDRLTLRDERSSFVI